MRRLKSSHIAFVAGLLALNIFNIFFTSRQQVGVSHDLYSYIDEDFPEIWPINELNKIVMTAEESVHYSILGPDAREEWATSSPTGYGYLRLGVMPRAFGLAMAHEQHCLRNLRAALEVTQSIRPAVIHFCLNYIRQMVLCSPNFTLEPIDVMNVDKVDKKGAIHICEDWREVYMELENNFNDWEVKKKSPDSQT